MNDAGERLTQDRAKRDAARKAFDANVSQVRADLTSRSIGGRIADKASAEAMGALNEAAAIARESKGIIAATLAALLVWFLRNPLLGLLNRKFGRDKSASQPDAVQED